MFNTVNLKKISAAFAICATLWGCGTQNQQPPSTQTEQAALFGRWNLVRVDKVTTEGEHRTCSETSVGEEQQRDWLTFTLFFGTLELNSDELVLNRGGRKMMRPRMDWEQTTFDLLSKTYKVHLINGQLHLQATDHSITFIYNRSLGA